MKTSCPACGATASLDVLLGNEGAREAVLAALAMPAPIGKLLVQYLGLFRPASRNLSFDRVANLINELLPMIAEAKIERNGRIWSAPQDYWRMALEEMLAKRDSLTLPLKSHGYLLAVIEGYNLKAEQRQEKQHEDRITGRTPVGTPPAATASADRKTPDRPRSEMPESVREHLKNFGKKCAPRTDVEES
ncbi:MAG: hypothetical protein PHH47_13010 [Gallionella sp.]|nr:hypothetical protein [Gallionella sp.]MDD4947608.1 hypothetical protein [Gallionella sp.]MDD5612450.1 hypothetical protein [Gallionella sp.]